MNELQIITARPFYIIDNGTQIRRRQKELAFLDEHFLACLPGGNKKVLYFLSGQGLPVAKFGMSGEDRVFVAKELRNLLRRESIGSVSATQCEIFHQVDT